MSKYGVVTNQKKQSIFEQLKSFDLKKIKNFNWKKLSKEEKRKVVIAGFIFFVFIIVLALFSQSDEEAYKNNINNFLKATTKYDVSASSKETTSNARQLVMSQENKIKDSKNKNFQTNIENADIKIISQKGNSIIGTTRLITNEVRPNEEVKKFSHLFVFKSQKVGASWKVANMLEAEAKLMNK